VVLTVMWRSGQDLDDLLMNNLVWQRWEVWRAISSTLLHVNYFHLAFNVYWIWTFGTLVERVFGHVYCAGIFLLLAFGSMLAEFAVLTGGVGLSGVGYGLWGMLWVLEKRDARFADAVDSHTSQMFVGWFFLCIILTVTGVMPVANIAHGVGALMGILLGFAICGTQAAKRNSTAGLIAIVFLALVGSTVFWPSANFSQYAESEIERAGLAALDRNDPVRAVKLLESAARMKHAPARAWYNLGVAYRRAGRIQDAVLAYEHAGSMPDADADMRGVAKDLSGFGTLSITNH